MILPTDLENIILDYAFGYEHQQKYTKVLHELVRRRQMAFFSQVRLEFLGTFYPDFYTDLLINGNLLEQQTASFSDV